MWDGADVWIIGGGPSIPKQFDIPEKVIKSVVSGASPPSEYSPYMSFLHDKHVIGINVAYKLGNWIDMVFFGDMSFLPTYKEDFVNFPNLKVSCATNVEPYPWIKYLPRDNKKNRGISSDNTCVAWNNNSGAAAISIAAHAGAKRIFLLGFDMKLGDTANQHWHDIYKRGPCTDPKRIQKLPFQRHLRGFPLIKQDAQRMGVSIINVSPTSAIECFEKTSMKKIYECY
jgi:hypothetical protein